jgi:transposase
MHRYEQVQTRFAQGQSLRQMAAACGLNTKPIRSWCRTELRPCDQRGYRGTRKIDPYIPSLQSRLAEGCRNQSRLWREMQHQGFTGARSLVATWMHAHGQPTPVAPAPAAPQLPAARQLAWLLCQDAEKRSADEQALVVQFQQHTERTHVQQGTAMIRQRPAADLDAWLQSCQASPSVELQNFVDVLQRDYAAVKAALTLP